MLTIVVAVAICVALALAVRYLTAKGATRAVSAEVDRFTTARQITTRWASDPSSAPGPVLDIARHRENSRADSETADVTAG